MFTKKRKYNRSPNTLIFSQRRFRRQLTYFIAFSIVGGWIWSYIPYERQKLTGAYCEHFESAKSSVRGVDDVDGNLALCSFDRIDACQLIQKRSLLYIISSKVGFVSELNNMLNAFAYSVSTKRRFFIDGQRWNYGSFDNYFDMRQSGFTPYLRINERSIDCNQRTFHSMTPSHYYNDQTDHLMISRDEKGQFDLLNAALIDYERRNLKGLRSIERKRQVAQFLWQYLSRQTIEKLFNNFRQNHPSLSKVSHLYGIHVRRGDKLLGESPLNLTTFDYVDGLEKLVTKLQYTFKELPSNANPTTHSRTVFVASDAQQTVLEELKDLRPQWNFVHLDYNDQQKQSSSSSQNLEGHNQSSFNLLSVERKFYQTNMFLTELTILSKTDGIVCTFSSNVCRFIQLLRKQNEDTVLSLDVKWFPG